MAEQKIRLNDRFSVNYDSFGNHWLTEHRVSKKGANAGKEYETGEAYCGYPWSFAHLLEHFIEKRVPEIDAKEVKDVLTAFATVESELRELAVQLGNSLDKKARRK